MQIISSGDNLYEMSNPTFLWENNNNKKVCYLQNVPSES